MTARNTYLRPMAGWYRRNPRFKAYLLREGTSVLLAIYAGLLLWGLTALAAGPEAYSHWLSFLSSPVSVVLHILILVAAIYHTYTWFQVSPKAMPPVVVGGRRLPDRVIVAGGYASAGMAALLVLFVAW